MSDRAALSPSAAPAAAPRLQASQVVATTARAWGLAGRPAAALPFAGAEQPLTAFPDYRSGPAMSRGDRALHLAAAVAASAIAWLSVAAQWR